MNHLRVVLFIISVAFLSNVTAQSVYTTKTGEKYHKSSCRYLKYSKKEMTLKKALNYGYVACKVCKPTKTIKKVTLNANTSSKGTTITPRKKITTTSSKKSVAMQCSGKTKSGARCKRKTKSSSGKCYQHG